MSCRNHRDRYSDYFRKIPVDLEWTGNVFPDNGVMVTTVIEYDKKNVSVEMVDKNIVLSVLNCIIP